MANEWRRVAVTGIGIISPLGVGTEQTWSGLVNGKSAIGPATLVDTSSLHSQLAAEIPDFRPEEFAHRRILRMMTRNDQLALAGATLALRDAGWEAESLEPERVGVFVGTSKNVGNPHLLESAIVARNEQGTADVRRIGTEARTFYPLFYVEGLPAGSLFYISLVFGFMGPNTHFVGMSDAGLIAIARAFRTVRRGEAELVVAGGFDDPVSWWGMPRFDATGTLTRRNELGAAACRPYDRDASGMVLGEGSSFLVLEELDRAIARGARIYAEVTGTGTSFDAYRLFVPDPCGHGVGMAIQNALADSDMAAGDVDLVVADGNGWPPGDAAETRGLRSALGSANPAATSVKAATGDMLAGAGALNAAVACLALHRQMAPPTLNLECPQPDCGIDWVRGSARRLDIRGALAIARGLDGANVCLGLQQVS